MTSSMFTDSAISLETSSIDTNKLTMSAVGNHEDVYQISISARLNQLAAVAWAMEEGEGFDRSKRRKLEHRLCEFEAVLNDDRTSDARQSRSTATTEYDDNSSMPADSTVQDDHVSEDLQSSVITDTDLQEIQRGLSITVASMHTRLEEQRHLYDLTVRKLEGVARNNLEQGQALKQWRDKTINIQQTCRGLNKENEILRQRITELESESLHKEVAVDAMSSAVAGLEGWINSTPASRQSSPDPPKKLPKTVIRGRGRFRGRYLVDEQLHPDSVDGEPRLPSEEFREGVRAWLRGFRDVEEELRLSRSSDCLNSDAGIEYRNCHGDDDWGDFVTVSQVM